MKTHQSSDHKNGDSKAGTQAGGLTPKPTGASLNGPSQGPSGENADKGNRNKRS